MAWCKGWCIGTLISVIYYYPLTHVVLSTVFWIGHWHPGIMVRSFAPKDESRKCNSRLIIDFERTYSNRRWRPDCC